MEIFYEDTPAIKRAKIDVKPEVDDRKNMPPPGKNMKRAIAQKWQKDLTKINSDEGPCFKQNEKQMRGGQKCMFYNFSI